MKLTLKKAKTTVVKREPGLNFIETFPLQWENSLLKGFHVSFSLWSRNGMEWKGMSGTSSPIEVYCTCLNHHVLFIQVRSVCSITFSRNWSSDKLVTFSVLASVSLTQKTRNPT